MNKNYLMATLFMVFSLPLLLCLFLKAFPIASAGPMVPITGIMNAINLPFLLYFGFFELTNNQRAQIVAVILSIMGGLFLAVVEMNAFMAFSEIFGIKDDQLILVSHLLNTR